MTVHITEMPVPSTELSRDPDAPDIPLPPLPNHWRSLARAFVHTARRYSKKVAMADSAKASLTYGDLFLRSVALGRALSRIVGPDRHVGVFQPPVAPTAVVNVALSLFGKIPVNLNYTASKELVDSSIDQCGVKHVVSSKRILDKFKFAPKGKLVLLEDVAKSITTADKIWAAAVANLVPISLLGAFLPGLKGDNLDATATIIFTSGSTGDPKGVVLSNRNVLSNVHQIQNQINLLEDEVVLGVLPFFHSFGFTVTIWTVLCLGKKAVYHFNPLDAKIVGELCRDHKCTLLICTPTFMRGYLNRAEPGAFGSVVHLVLGAEKLRPELAKEIRAKLGIEPLEGYGCTELSPVVSVNVPHDRPTRDGRTISGNRPGSVGTPLPGTAIKSVDPDTSEPLPRGREGMLLVKGPQVMVGYLNKPDATAAVVKDGWYTTGDLGYQDHDGFIWITDRLSRFSKIAGEMVSHLKIENAIMEATGKGEESAAVTSVADAKRGERLVVVYTELGLSPQEVCKKLLETGLPKLWTPSAEDFIQVEAVPTLGTGKIDLRRLKETARERLETPGT
jgi:acyl-[acyl-carrier-protein]-phospholipid O-acyltransferase / long-chain-fatty-acid--[acyl-carrier-protein] ligase